MGAPHFLIHLLFEGGLTPGFRRLQENRAGVAGKQKFKYFFQNSKDN